LVSAIIPARNEEASIARAVESVAAQGEVGEVIVVDDQSTDRTGEILQELAARVPKLKVLHTAQLPAGWIGKNHAVSIGAAAAQGEWLLFTDADTYHYAGSTRRALSDAVARDAVLISYSPEQEMGSVWERALIPFVFCRLGANFSYAKVNDPRSPVAAANGQFLLILRDVYERVGGHAAVAGEVLEDVALACNVKRAGYSIYFTAPFGVVQTRMYRTFEAMWQGWTKNLYLLLGGKPTAALRELFGVTPILWVLLFILLRWLTPLRWEGLGLFALCLVLLAHAHYAKELYKNLFPIALIEYYVPGMCLYTAALIDSWWKNTRGSVVWKGRAYRARTQ
jgi:glycosyltransferase involved in cell wall biosynthesis